VGRLKNKNPKMFWSLDFLVLFHQGKRTRSLLAHKRTDPESAGELDEVKVTIAL
jgi:hypothetical protein